MTNFNFLLRSTQGKTLGKAFLSWQKSLTQRSLLLPVWTITILSTLSFGVGLVLDITGLPLRFEVGSQVLAQAITETEIKSYSKAVLLMEPLRQAAYTEIKKIIGSGDIPTVNCHKKESLDTLPKSTRSIAINYCNRSKKIVEDSGLTISRFNAITVQLQEDAELEKKVQAELLRLQKSSVTP